MLDRGDTQTFSSDFLACFTELMKSEGVYDDAPDDPGGETKWGITQKTANRHGFVSHIRNIEQAKQIYWKEYWVATKCDQIAEKSLAIAYEVFEWGVNAGSSRPGRALQIVLNMLAPNVKLKVPLLKEDGQIGDRTVACLYTMLPGYELSVCNSINGEQYIFYKQRASESEYMRVRMRGLTGNRLHSPFLGRESEGFPVTTPTTAPSVTETPQPSEAVPSIELETNRKYMRRALYFAGPIILAWVGIDGAEKVQSNFLQDAPVEVQQSPADLVKELVPLLVQSLTEPTPTHTPFVSQTPYVFGDFKEVTPISLDVEEPIDVEVPPDE